MSNADPIAVLIPWYANGTLGADEREKVESHLPDCPSCYALLARARAFRRLAPVTGEEALLGHVEGHLLVQFAEQPDRLEPDARRFISTHLSDCSTCAEALELVQDLSLAPLDSGERELPAARGPLAGLIDAAVAFWRGLSRTILRPAPALVYLGALIVVLAVVLPRWPGDAPVAVTALPPAVRLPEEVIMRGDVEAPEPQEIQLQADADLVVLELITSIDLEDLSDPTTGFRVEVLAGERMVHQLTRRGSDFDRRGRLSLILDPGAFAIGETSTIRLLFRKDDDVRDGDLVYRKSFQFTSPVATKPDQK